MVRNDGRKIASPPKADRNDKIKMISAIILTKNEENNIKRCLSSVIWCDEIVVIDDFSKDETIKRIRSFEERYKNKKINIIKNAVNGDFASQRNFAMQTVTGDWILYLDADEYVSKDLKNEIREAIKDDMVQGYLLKRQDVFFGKNLNFGETPHVKLLRLGRKDFGPWRGQAHEYWDIHGKISELNNPILHNPHPTIRDFLKKINLYTDILADEWKEKGKIMPVYEIVLYPLGKFVQNYFFRQGFRDKVPGLIMAMMMSFHSFLVRAKYCTKYQNK